ncbi:MAG: hypothetical protein WA804_23345, partial [Terriglobales bacterium]
TIGAILNSNLNTMLKTMSNSRDFLLQLLFCTLTAMLAAAPAPAQDQAGAPPAPQPPVAYASVSELNSILGQLQQTVKSIQSDLASMRIERWKTDGATKKQTLADIDSIQRNLQSTLPETIAQLNNSPEDLGASFKLYRNLDALYSVFGSVTELAGAFGSKDEFQSLDNDLNGLKSARRDFGDRMQKLTASKEDELTRLRAQVKTLTAAPPPPPKKIVVDDTETPKKPVKKKPTAPKPAATTPKPPTTPATPPASPPPTK